MLPKLQDVSTHKEHITRTLQSFNITAESKKDQKGIDISTKRLTCNLKLANFVCLCTTKI